MRLHLTDSLLVRCFSLVGALIQMLQQLENQLKPEPSAPRKQQPPPPEALEPPNPTLNHQIKDIRSSTPTKCPPPPPPRQKTKPPMTINPINPKPSLSYINVNFNDFVVQGQSFVVKGQSFVVQGQSSFWALNHDCLVVQSQSWGLNYGPRPGSGPNRSRFKANRSWSKAHRSWFNANCSWFQARLTRGSRPIFRGSRPALHTVSGSRPVLRGSRQVLCLVPRFFRPEPWVKASFLALNSGQGNSSSVVQGWGGDCPNRRFEAMKQS